MKLRAIIIVIIASLLLSLTGCGGSKPATTTPTNTQSTTQTQQNQQAQPQQQQQSETKSNTSTQATTPAQVTTNTQAATTPAVTSTPPAQTEKKDVTVYVTKTGEKYHRAGCSSLSKSQIPKSLSEAKAAGYTPCSKCNPPQ